MSKWRPVESVIPKKHEQRALLKDQYGHIVIGNWQTGLLSPQGGPWLVEGDPKELTAGARFQLWHPFPK